ncbi:phospholipase D-like domain-containing protein [Methylobacterium oxalidis]|uniref:Phospholipase D n=1 Tax=Methylobacterium oxalidis TaxID=944322 RepID=A0A512J6X2_9HYPH|nr:phospholipase D-like domain-containing protein [Methylobacterium oxalidis]GEP05718.1 cardiolipin synthase [Methylobacterium oxalidis]GJE32072.1 Major cardiolipin synthase ClsA [Methylobacterium oxalidis]GLS67917.1 cardiolipin synthase [Methylobacterium oxalidis]
MEEALNRWLEATASIRTDVLAALGLVLALGVSGHVLLRKREISVAIGWIGLAWLSPIFGTGLYALFGVNRVSRRARRLRPKPSQQPSDPREPETSIEADLRPLERAGRQITQLPLVAGNRVAVFRNGDEAYPAMLAAIAAAERSVALSSYIFRDDETGRAFCEALAAARARGAEVRVLIDGIGGGYFDPAASRRLRRAGVPAGLFMHSALPWRMPFLNLRTHKKLLILDGRTAFTGGINISDANRVSLGPPHPVRDTHFRIDGPVVEQLMMAFGTDWNFVMNEELDGERWFPEIRRAGETTARVVTSGPDADIEKIEFVVLAALSCARRSVRLVTPYFLPSEIVLNALALAALRGVTVDVIIPRRSDHRFVDWATRAHLDPLLESGVRIWLDEPPFDHSKILVVDEAWCFVGSANWDTRSFRLNFELNVEIYDSGLARRLDAFMAGKMETRLTKAAITARPLPVRFRDAGARLLLPYL